MKPDGRFGLDGVRYLITPRRPLSVRFSAYGCVAWRLKRSHEGGSHPEDPSARIDYRTLAFDNFHHSGDNLASYLGPDPIAALVRDGRIYLVLTIHEITDDVDGGQFVARSCGCSTALKAPRQ